MTGALRGYARADAGRLAALLDDDPAPTAGRLLGKGYMALTVDQGPDTERQQGIVAIAGASLADIALHYFATSEQLQVWLRLAAARTAAGWRAGALMLERSPPAAGSIRTSTKRRKRRAGGPRSRWPKRHRGGTSRRRPGADRLVYQPVPHRGGRGRPSAGARLWLPLLAPAPVRHTGGVRAGRPRPHGGGRRHRHDLRVLQLRFPLSARNRCRRAERRAPERDLQPG